MTNLKLTIDLPIPEPLEDEAIGNAVPDIIRALVAEFYPAAPDSLPLADITWSQSD